MLLVPDVSRYQGDIDFGVLKDHVQAIVIKATGADAGLYTDSKFVANRNGARANKIPRWFYHYKGAAGSATQQANFFLDSVGSLFSDEHLVLDDENEPTINTAFINEFAGVVRQRTGKKIIVYSNQGRFTSYPPYPLWVANYGVNNGQPGTKPNVPGMVMWQYTSVGSVPGISGNVDLSQYYGTVSDFKNQGGNMAGYWDTVPSNAEKTTMYQDTLGRKPTAVELANKQPRGQVYKDMSNELKVRSKAQSVKITSLEKQLASGGTVLAPGNYTVK